MTLFVVLAFVLVGGLTFAVGAVLLRLLPAFREDRLAAPAAGAGSASVSILFYFISPGYFDPLIESPSAPMLVGGGLALQILGFAVIWRMARIKV